VLAYNGLAEASSPVNGRKLFTRAWLLRNSTIFRFAKNRDSDSARRKLQARVKSLSSDLIVHGAADLRNPSRRLLWRLES